MPGDLSVLMVTFNRREYTRRTLKSLQENGVNPSRDGVIVDNSSTEIGMKKMLETWVHKVIHNPTNVGWGAAVNIGLPWCDGEYILFSNNDVEYQPHWYIRSMELFAKYPKIGILGLWKHTAHSVVQDLGDFLIKDDMPAVAWLMPRHVVEEIGAFPEKGPCLTKGGNGEDSHYVHRVQAAGYWVGGPKEDFAIHIDGY